MGHYRLKEGKNTLLFHLLCLLGVGTFDNVNFNPILGVSVNVNAFVATPIHPPKHQIPSTTSTICSSSTSASPSSSLSQPIRKSKLYQKQRLSVILRETNHEFMKQKNNLKLDQSYERNSIRIDSDSRTKNDIDNYFNNTDTLNTYANKNKSQKHKKYRNSPDRGPYADFSENELYELTETVLSPSSSSPEQRTTSTPTLSTNLKMTRQELHEATRLMSSWTKRKVEKSGVLAERLLNRVIDEKVGGNEDVNLTPIMFHMAITAWLNCGQQKDAFKAASIFERMIMMYEKDIEERNAACEQNQRERPYPMPNTAICNVVLESLAKCKMKEAALYSELILRKMEQLSTLHNHNPANDESVSTTCMEIDIAMDKMALTTTKPNVRTYNAVMNAWAQARTKSSGENAELILLKVRNLYESTQDPYVQPNQKSYNIAIHSWAKCKSKGSANRAEQILKLMEEDYESGKNLNAKPDNISYTSVLTAWANSNDKVSARRAEEILERIERLYYDGEEGKAESWPDTISYNAVLNVYAKSEDRDAGERCESLFQKMEYLYRMGNDNVKPDLVSYNSLINVIATNPGTPAAAHRAGEILEQMEKLYKEGDDSVKPDVVTYNSVIKAYSNSREATAAETAERILNRMEVMHEEDDRNIQPDAYTYNTVIHCWANSGHIYAAQRAEYLLQQMAKKYSVGNKSVKPTAVSYNSVLNALSKTNDSDAPQRSERILKQMVYLFNSGDTTVKPDVFSFCTVINTWSKSKELDKAHKAVSLLRQMEQMKIRPNVFVYTAVLNACAYTFGDEERKRDAMNMAVEILGELRNCEHCNANHVTYATFFKACSNLLPEDDIQTKDSLIERVWRQSISEGQVGPATLVQFERAASHRLYISSVGDYLKDGESIVAVNDLPKRWTCNVREKRYRKYMRKNKSKTDR